ncbi:hypothetical protein BDR06DRAFT_975901 [Suillus hirtellus]|nr:hypothetical protein BDR06DRAFT_975901 [Suillus hirtellus]
MLSEPSSVSTSALTLAAIQEEGEQGWSLLDALISALMEPVPFSADGETDKDDEFEENIVRILYTFATSCNGVFSAVQKRSLWGFLGRLTTTQGEENLNFGLTSGEWEEVEWGCEVIVRCVRQPDGSRISITGIKLLAIPATTNLDYRCFGRILYTFVTSCNGLQT